MKNIWLGLTVLLAAMPTFAQNVEELKRQLAEKEAETRQLRERIQILEREVTPHRIRQAKSLDGAFAGPEDEREDSNRALERALVRESGLLLPPRRFEIEPDFVYSHSNLAGFRRDAFGPALTLRAGLPWRSQVDLSLPYVFERRRSTEGSYDTSGIGDISLDLSHQLLVERTGRPGLIGSLGYQASTGRNTLFESATPVALGSGFNAAQASLRAIKRVDPLVYYGSYSFIRYFSETRAGIAIDPGNSHGLRFGTALASGPGTSLRAALNLTFFDKTRYNGIALEGSNDPAALLEFGSSTVLSESTLLDITVGAGLTRNAPNYRLGIALPIRF
jgi:hypothetical protein